MSFYVEWKEKDKKKPTKVLIEFNENNFLKNI